MIEHISERIALSNGVAMPGYGAGVFKVEDTETARVVCDYLEAGYRLIDTAAMYGNEAGVGRGVRESGLAREDIFVTTKLWDHFDNEAAVIRAFEDSLRRMGLEYVDLYLIHWPKPALGLYVTMWRAFEKICRSGRARAIGVSNFQPAHLDRLARECEIVPMVNQIEMHPYLLQKALLEDHRRRGIVVQAWAPLARGRFADDPVLQGLAEKYGRTPAQIVLRWHVQHGVVPLPKSADPGRMRENADVFGFCIDEADMAKIDALNCDLRTGPHPDTMNH